MLRFQIHFVVATTIIAWSTIRMTRAMAPGVRLPFLIPRQYTLSTLPSCTPAQMCNPQSSCNDLEREALKKTGSIQQSKRLARRMNYLHQTACHPLRRSSMKRRHSCKIQRNRHATPSSAAEPRLAPDRLRLPESVCRQVGVSPPPLHKMRILKAPGSPAHPFRAQLQAT